MRIGEVLKEARRRAGLEMREVEERTKIRIKYLRALENEEWDALPSPAYAKGFLRTYGQLLGLDGEALADAFRRQVERGRSDPAYPLGDQVLVRGRRPGEARGVPRWAVLAIGLAVVVAAVFLVIGLLGEDESGDGGSAQRAAGGGGEQTKPARQAEGPRGTVTLELAIREPVQICLLGGGGEALIDGQVLNAGDRESFERKRFQLRFPSGFDPDHFRLKLAGERRLLPRADGPAAYEIIAPRHVEMAKAPGKECP
jgi:transcriptional regulator with XRE-family HTH domain